MATTTATDTLPAAAVSLEAVPDLVAQFRKFLWLASGMFSTSALAIAFMDYFAAGAYEQAGTHFLAAVVAAVLFGVATLFKLGPDEA